MDAEVMKKHIDLYVNDYSIDLGDKGKNAIKTLYNEALKRDLIPVISDKIFIGED